MTKTQVMSLVRHFISAIGGILVAYGLLESGLVLEITGVICGLTAAIWSIIDKTAVVAKVEGVVRQVLTLLSGFMVFKTYLTPDLINSIVSVVVAILPFVLGQTDKVKQENDIITEDTSGS